MGLFDLFKAKSNDSGLPKIRSKKDLIFYLQGFYQDAEAITCMTDVLERIGPDGYVVIKRGGGGTPYKAEYQDFSKFKDVPTEEIKRRINQLKEEQRQVTSELEKDYYQQKIAEAGGGLATIWIKSDSEGEFTIKQKLLKNIFGKAQEAIKNQ